MNEIQGTTGASTVSLQPYQAVAPPGLPSAPTSLLLEPPSLSDDDAVADLLAVEARSRSSNLNRAIRNIQNLRQEQRVAWEKQKAALLEAARAQEDSGFWGGLGKLCGTIGKVAAVVTSVAVAAGSGGAALPLVLGVAGACLSTAAVAQGEFEVLQKLGVDDELSRWVELGLAVGGVACTAGAAWTSAAKSATELQRIATTAERVSSAAAGGVTLTAGIATGKERAADANAQDRFADAASARLDQSRLDDALLRILDDLEESEQAYRHTVGRAKGTFEIEDNTLLASIGRN
jgi:hypothetical protein